MGTIIGAVSGIIIFLIFGLLPVFRLSSYLALLFLNKVTGKSVEPTPVSRVLISSFVIICILSGAVCSLLVGAIIGSLLHN